MTAKEKAKELVEKYNPLVTTWDCYSDSPRLDEDIIIEAKQCALIAVDEIMEVCYYTREVEFNDFFSYDYWQEVKQEIQAL